MSDNAHRRLVAITRTLHEEVHKKRVLVLPDDAQVDLTHSDAGDYTQIAIDARAVCIYRTLPKKLALVISSIGTPYENSAEHVPQFYLLELLPPNGQGADHNISIADLWGTIHALFTVYHEQETIPIVLSPAFSNIDDATTYLLRSGLARRRHTAYHAPVPTDHEEPELFLLRAAFFQGAGTNGYHARGWLRSDEHILGRGVFPDVQSFTRSPLVITAHPLRAPKPRPGELLYRKYFPAVGQSLEFTHLDPADQDGKPGPHLAAFHKWHNSPRVNSGWGEAGPIEKHREYVRKVMADPGILPLIMSWDGELMGYAEIVWAKENHISQYIPGGARDYDRGIHVLAGEDKFRGRVRSKAWFGGITHYCFLSDPRTQRVVGEPKANNEPIIDLSLALGMHLESMFDLPYKRSVMTCNLRDRFFKHDLLTV